MSNNMLHQLAYDQAKKSTCKKRQVGCIIYDHTTEVVVGQGYNVSSSCACNDATVPDGVNVICPSDVVHAEAMAIEDAFYSDSSPTYIPRANLTMYVTHPPCNKCLELIGAAPITMNLVVCEQFLKFDNDKIRYDLIPPKWEEYEAKVLTHGAKKYKPNNWRTGDKNRYYAALRRHLNAYMQGEWLDDGPGGTGLPHLVCVRVNAGFLLTIEEENNE